MSRWLNCIILIALLVGVLPIRAYCQEELPFWRQKPKLLKQILEQRKVLVSVKMDPRSQGQKIKLLGVGVVNVPIYFAVDQIQRFEDLPKVSSYFQKVKHAPEKKEVYFFIKALGTQVRFIQKYQWGKQSAEFAQMDWIITWGRLKGMVGHYSLRKISPTKTEIAIWAGIKKMDIPLPDFLINFTLEVIAEKTAQKMRTFIEANHRQAQQPREDYVQRR